MGEMMAIDQQLLGLMGAEKKLDAEPLAACLLARWEKQGAERCFLMWQEETTAVKRGGRRCTYEAGTWALCTRAKFLL